METSKAAVNRSVGVKSNSRGGGSNMGGSFNGAMSGQMIGSFGAKPMDSIGQSITFGGTTNPNLSKSLCAQRNIKNQSSISSSATPNETSRFNQSGKRQNNNNRSKDNSLMIPAGNPSSNATPQKRTGKKPQREIIQEVSESPEKHQEIPPADLSNLTTFQNYMIAKHSSPMTKLKDRDTIQTLAGTSLSPVKEQPPLQHIYQQPPTYHHHYHHGQQIPKLANPQATLDVHPMTFEVVDQRKQQSNLRRSSYPLNNEGGLYGQQQQHHPLNDSRSSNHSGTLFQPIINSGAPIQNQIQESYMSPLRRDRGEQNLSNSEEKRRSRGQPSQAPNIQNLSNVAALIQSASQQQQARAMSQLRQSHQNQSPAPAQRMLNQSINPDDSIQQIVQGLGASNALQLNNSFGNSNGLQGPALIQYYQQRYNMIQQAAMQLKQIQQQSQLALLQAQQQQSTLNPAQQQVFATFDNLTPNRDHHSQRAKAPPLNHYQSNQQSPSRHRFQQEERVTSSIDQDLFKVLNKRVIQDFEHKPLHQIKSRFIDTQNIDSELKSLSLQPQVHNNTGMEVNLMTQLNQYKTVQATMNQAATNVQKYLKGFIIRRRFNTFAKLYFLFKRYKRRVYTLDISQGLRDCFVQVKGMRKQMLEIYVNKCATKIQKLYRGWYVRERIRPLKINRLFSSQHHQGHIVQKIRAIVKGWRLRKIMRTKEIVTQIRQIKDYQAAYLDLNINNNSDNNDHRRQQLQRSLLMSRANTIQKMIMGIDRMQLGGLWLKYALVNSQTNEQQQKPSSVSRSVDRKANNSRLTAASKRANGAAGAIMPVLSHSKVNTSDKGKYLTIEQAARQTQQQQHPHTKLHQRNNNLQIKQTVDSASFNSMTSGGFAFGTQQQQPAAPLNQSTINRQTNANNRSFNYDLIQIQNPQPIRVVHTPTHIIKVAQTPPPVPQQKSVESKANAARQQPLNLDEVPVKGIQQLQQSGVNNNNNYNSITTYDEMPLMNLSKVQKSSGASAAHKYSVERNRLEPNFKSEAYKKQAQEIYQRRMHYNPREAASKSRDRPLIGQQNNQSVVVESKVDEQAVIVKVNENQGRNLNQSTPSKTANAVPHQQSSFEKVASRATASHKYPSHIHQQVIEEEKRRGEKYEDLVSQSSVSQSYIFQKGTFVDSRLNQSSRSSCSIDQTVNKIVQSIMQQQTQSTPQRQQYQQQSSQPIKAYNSTAQRLTTIEEQKTAYSPQVTTGTVTQRQEFQATPTLKYYERPTPSTTYTHPIPPPPRDVVTSPLAIKQSKPSQSPLELSSKSQLRSSVQSQQHHYSNTSQRRTREERKKIKQQDSRGSYQTTNNHIQQLVDTNISMFDNSQKLQLSSNRQFNSDQQHAIHQTTLPPQLATISEKSGGVKKQKMAQQQQQVLTKKHSTEGIFKKTTTNNNNANQSKRF